MKYLVDTNGNLIKKWDYKTKAAKELGILDTGNISGKSKR